MGERNKVDSYVFGLLEAEDKILSIGIVAEVAKLHEGSVTDFGSASDSSPRIRFAVGPRIL